MMVELYVPTYVHLFFCSYPDSPLSAIDKYSCLLYYTPCQEEPPVCAGEPVAIAKRVHPFPSRTRKLSSSALTILWGQPHGKIGRRRFARPNGWFFYFLQNKSFLFRWCKRSSWIESIEVYRMLFKGW